MESDPIISISFQDKIFCSSKMAGKNPVAKGRKLQIMVTPQKKFWFLNYFLFKL